MITAAGTFVATKSISSVDNKAEMNVFREDTASYAEFDKLINAVGDDKERYEKITEMLDIIEGNYLREYDTDKLWENVYSSLLETLGDNYAQYLTVEEYNSFLDNRDGGFVGIGVHATYDPDTHGIYIFGVLPDSPAEASGLKKGDIITKVEDIEASEGNYYTLADAIRGKEGSEVKISVLRGEEALDVTLIRKAVASENVIYEKLDADTAYMHILSFSGETVADEFSNKLETAQTDGCTKFVFDVRNNLGGDLTAIRDVLDILLPEGPIINYVDKNGNKTTINSDAECIKGEFVVLCNSTTASAAELFTAALRDYDLAEIVGKTTFGKGSMQTTMLLSDGSALKLSTAYYNPPSNKSYDGIGIVPDYDVDTDEKWADKFYQMPKEEDTQLQKALELLNSTKSDNNNK